MPSYWLDKALLAGAATATAGSLAWHRWSWIKYDLQMIQMRKRLQKSEEDVMTGFLIDKFEAHVATHPQKAMLIYEDCIYTYEFMNQQANRVANTVHHLGLQFGDTAAMMIHSEPAFVWTFLGLQKIGVSVALINFNLRFKLLSYSVLSTEPKAFIVGAGEDLVHAVCDVAEELQGLPVYIQGLAPSQVPVGMKDFDSLMMKALPVQPDASVRSQMTKDSIMSYFYTSGTTGLPKPVYTRQLKANYFAGTMLLVDLSSDDILYTVLPLYHAAGGGMGLYGLLYKVSGYLVGLLNSLTTSRTLASMIGSFKPSPARWVMRRFGTSVRIFMIFVSVTGGCTMVLRKKFSASHFWSDCRKHNVTVVQYIGEIFRYILAQPEHELDGVHKLKAAYGNGLRTDIFDEVLKRFKIPLICEMFGSTEGVRLNYNIANKPGAVGRFSPLLNMTDPNPNVLVKFEYSSAMPIRDKNGRCIKIKPGEAGLYMSKVPDVMLTKGDLIVYKASKEANEKKVVRNAFKEGDMYFNYGDVLYLDNDYFLYFRDRIGDTFRWKGENVSTTEVANIMSRLSFIHDANVYGVTVPGHDGRAGMAALILKEGESITPERLKQMYKMCQHDLPSYARPLFLRILPDALVTGTFKQNKVELIEEGYDTTKVKDDLFYLDSKAQTYSPLTPEGLVSFLQSRL